MTALVEGTGFNVTDIGTGALGGLKMVLVKTVNTADATNTIPVTLTKYGIAANGFIGLLSWTHSADNSISFKFNSWNSSETTGEVYPLTI